MKTLILTVGGSPKPLRSAMEAVRPDRVHFIVSDGSGDSPSSRAMVKDREISYDDKTGKTGPGLKYLPACPSDVRISEVPPDDLDTALARIDLVMEQEHAGSDEIIADYTGGTKTMTAALVLAATAHEGMQLQFMAGRRANLEQVQDGTEQPLHIPKELIGLAQLFGLVRQFVQSREYHAALATLQQVEMGLQQNRHSSVRAPKGWRKRCDDWKRWLAIFAAWDRFDHADALQQFEQALDQGKDWAEQLEADGWLKRLQKLAHAAGQPTYELVEDLWLNALRRGDLRQYDDAMARFYRLAEAAVQARMHDLWSISTDCVPEDEIPEDLRKYFAGSRLKVAPCYRLGLHNALKLLQARAPDDRLLQAWDNIDQTPHWQGQRNRSILAHGFRPLTKGDYNTAFSWFNQRRTTLWEEGLQRPTADQLPTQLP